MKNNTPTLKTFTTEPKTRRHTKTLSISIERCFYFMEHLWKIRLKDCSYETLEFEFIHFFGTNEPRTVKRYLGIPEQVVSYAGASKVIRMNRLSGKLAQFEYFNERRIPPKRGLLEILGYITRYKNGNETRFRINHERMPYYTTQTTLENAHQETANIPQESEESSEASKEEMRVCSLYEEHHSQLSRSLNHAGLEEEVSVGETSVSPRTERQAEKTNIEATEKKEEESYRVHTHITTEKPQLGTFMENRIQNRIQKEWIKEAEELLEKIQYATLNINHQPERRENQ